MPFSPKIAIIGAGPGGLCAAIRLRQAGFDDFTIFERSGGVGGTWWNNRYPGLACDIPSHLYSFSFAPKADWTRPYASQPEIQEYLEACVGAYDLWPRIRLNTAVRGARWESATASWRLTTDGGEELADALISSQGMFNELNWPEIEGRDTFAGTAFHSGDWPHDQDLTGRRVAVVGSAASAVQFVPEIAPRVEVLHLFQRSANWVAPKEDTPYTPDQLAAFAADPEAAAAVRRQIFERIDPNLTFSNREATQRTEAACLAAMEVVRDPQVRAKLVPSTPYGCQRPLMSNDYYPTFNRDNVELVTDPITAITPAGVVTADGRERAVDTIIYATGYQATKYASSIELTGQGGTRIAEAWAGGAQAYLGITTAGFPNLFMLYGPNTNNGSITYMIECQVDYVVRLLQYMDKQQLDWLDVRPEVMAAYNEALQRDLDGVEAWQAGCHNYYRSPSGRIVTQWPHPMSTYRRYLDDAEPSDAAYAGGPAAGY